MPTSAVADVGTPATAEFLSLPRVRPITATSPIRYDNALTPAVITPTEDPIQIKGIGAISPDQLKFEVQQGGRFVIYQYCVSAIILTWRESTDIYFVRAGESRIVKGLPWALLTLFAGWWGIPWGPIYSVAALWKDLRGGEDVTAEILLQLNIGYVDLSPQPLHSG